MRDSKRSVNALFFESLKLARKLSLAEKQIFSSPPGCYKHLGRGLLYARFKPVNLALGFFN